MLVISVLNKILASDQGAYTDNSAETPSEKEKEVFLLQNASSYSSSQELIQNLEHLCVLIANALEAYSAVIFLANDAEKLLTVGAYHSLSREFVKDAKIRYGSGLAGWSAENKNKILVSTFENDATTLQYYAQDQALKSVISLPILNEQNELLGVLACDSKKSYAFTKVAEKTLLDCAKQAATIISLHATVRSLQQQKTVDSNSLHDLLEQLRNKNSEDDLLKAVANLPQGVVPHQAMVALRISSSHPQQTVYRSTHGNEQAHHYLLEQVLKHKKVICPNKSITFKSTAEKNDGLTFLSVPLRCLDQEGGSLNLISNPHYSFSDQHIAAVEQIAQILSQEMERLRLRQMLFDKGGAQGILSWAAFAERATQMLREVVKYKRPAGLLRIDLNSLGPLEDKIGIDTTVTLIDKISRIIEQIKLQDSPACRLYGNRFYIMLDKASIPAFITRYETLVRKISAKELGIVESLKDRVFQNTPGARILQDTRIYTAYAPRDGETLSELCSRIETLAHDVTSQKTTEEREDAGA